MKRTPRRLYGKNNSVEYITICSQKAKQFQFLSQYSRLNKNTQLVTLSSCVEQQKKKNLKIEAEKIILADEKEYNSLE